MSEVQRKIQFARKRGVFVFRWPAFYKQAWDGVYIYRRAFNREEKGPWAVYVDGEWAPRVGYTKRDAVNLAYAIAVSKKFKIKVEVM